MMNFGEHDVLVKHFVVLAFMAVTVPLLGSFLVEFAGIKPEYYGIVIIGPALFATIKIRQSLTSGPENDLLKLPEKQKKVTR